MVCQHLWHQRPRSMHFDWFIRFTDNMLHYSWLYRPLFLSFLEPPPTKGFKGYIKKQVALYNDDNDNNSNSNVCRSNVESCASVAIDDDSCSYIIAEDDSIVDYDDVDVSLTMMIPLRMNTVPNCLQHELFLNSTPSSTVATNKRPLSTN